MSKPAVRQRRRNPTVNDPTTVNKITAYLDSSVPLKHKLATERTLRGQANKTLALKIQCLQCTNYQPKEIELCAAVRCALHPYRPYQKKA